MTHPKIVDAGVVGLADELVGELPVGFVVKNAEDINEKEIQDFVASMCYINIHFNSKIQDLNLLRIKSNIIIFVQPTFTF